MKRANRLKTGPMQIHHGHTDTQVFVKFSRPCSDIGLDDRQLEDFIAALRESKRRLDEHRAKRLA